jgi:hypothetical protein
VFSFCLIRFGRSASAPIAEGHMSGRYATAFLSAAVMCDCTGRDIYRERSIVHKEVVVGVKAFY